MRMLSHAYHLTYSRRGVHVHNVDQFLVLLPKKYGYFINNYILFTILIKIIMI